MTDTRPTNSRSSGTRAEDLPYRPCVGVILFNDDRRVLVGRRIDTTMEAWQLPQGGIDPGESPRDCAFRELEEEIGTRCADIIAETEDWLTYDLPPDLIGKVWKGRYRGQRQKWFVMHFRGTDDHINVATPHPEFSDWQWIRVRDLPDMIVPFKRDLYSELVRRFGPLIEDFERAAP
ncbi:MAG: RNA pyrophosphohydrolase [Sphingomonadales bacterium]